MINCIVLGVGDRGTVYSEYALQNPQIVNIIACADSNPERLELFSNKHNISQDHQFSTWEEIGNIPKFADAVIITLPDMHHFQSAKTFLELGYNVLLEKPMATDPKQVLDLVDLDKKTPGILQICHVLRYTPFYNKIHQISSSGKLGQIVSIHLSENVGYYHYAHSFVRGNWRNRETSGPFMLTKSSHDLDILFWISGSVPKSISSFGSQRFFTKKNKPEGAPSRCTDGCPVEKTCPYFAPRIYLDLIPLIQINREKSSFFSRLVQTIGMNYPQSKKYYPFNKINQYSGWPVNVITPNPTYENREEAIKTGPYGKCVYGIEDHDIVDQQVAIIEFENGITSTFNLHGHASEELRKIRIEGTDGTLEGIFSINEQKIEIIDRNTKKKTTIRLDNSTSGHGGGDFGIFSDFISNISKNNGKTRTNAYDSSYSHLLAFAADYSRIHNKTVDYREFLESIRSI